VSLQIFHRLAASPIGTQLSPSRGVGPAPVTLNKPIQRLVFRWALLTVTFAAAVVLAACGGGSSDSISSAGGDLSPRMAQIVGTVEVAKSVDMKVLVISAEGKAPSYLATTSILDQIGVPYDKMVLKGANATALQMVAGTLSDGAGNGKYQGVILETGDLAAFNQATNNYPSALTAAQWAMLRQYQFDFGVRSATMYTRPAATIDVNSAPLDLTYGLTNAGPVISTDASPVTASFAPTGQQVFSYLNTANPISFKNAPGTTLTTYPSTPVPSTTAIPLLLAKDNTNTLASIYIAPQGWQNLTLSADNNPELTHTLLLGYGVVNWVTKGVFLGERKIYMTAQPDDVFIPDDLWNVNWKTATTGTASVADWRNNATDYNSLAAWQTAFQAKPNMAAFRLEMPFNGVGYNTTDSAYLKSGPDTLSAAVRANPNAFRWINHTWDHTSLNTTDPEDPDFVTPTLQSITNQLFWNHEVATGLRSGNPNVPAALKVTFTNYNKNAFIQPDISGLQNPVFWEAAQNFGLQYILMDTSKAYANFDPPRTVITLPDNTTVLSVISPNTGFYSSLDTFVPTNPRIFIIPRYPTNLFYNVSTPAEWVSEYNYIYGVGGIYPAGFGDSDYPTILGRQSDDLVRYMLKYNANSWMFHAANLRDYNGITAGNNSLLSDLLNEVAKKYSAMYNLPVLSPSQTEIGQIMKARMAYNNAIADGVKGRIVFGPSVTIEVTNPTGAAVTVPLTGAVSGGTSYGGQVIAPLAVVAGGTTTVAAPAGWIPSQVDLAVTVVPSTRTPLQGGTLTYSVVISNPGPNSVTNANFSNTLQAGLGTITNVVTQVSAGVSTPTFTTTPTSLSGLVSMPAGGQITVTYQASVSATATGTLTSTATATEPADRNDPNQLNNTATNSVTVGLADVSTLVTLPTTAIAGSVVTGTVTFSNASGAVGNASGIAVGTAVTATAVTGTVTLSNGEVKSFTVGNLAPGQSSVQTFTTTMGTTTLSATSTVSTTTLESNTANNTSAVSMTVASPSTPTPTPDPVPPVVAAPEPLPATGGGGGGCTTSPDAKFDPMLWMMLLAGGVATGLRRRRTADLVDDRH
jgi:hypothetical protein